MWEGVWCGESSLCDRFPTLYDIAGSKGAKVAEVWEISGGSGAWNPRFFRSLNDWEIEQVQNFIGLTNNKRIFPQKKDQLVWKGDILLSLLIKKKKKKGQFTVKAYCNSQEGGSPLKAPVKFCGTRLCLLKWAFLLGKLSRERSQQCNNLRAEATSLQVYGLPVEGMKRA